MQEKNVSRKTTALLQDLSDRMVNPVVPHRKQVYGEKPSEEGKLLHRVRKTRGRPGREAPAGLTTRETEIMRLIASGRTNKEIAEELGLSAHTVHRHRANIMRKLNMHRTAELVRYALTRGL